MSLFQEINEEAAAYIRDLQRRVRRLETLEESGGCLNLIEDQILTASASVITFSDIPQTFKHLWLWLDLLNASSAGSPSAALQFNGDTTSNYTYIRLEVGVGDDVHVGRGGDALDTEIDLRANTSVGGHHEVNIIDYTATGKLRQVTWKGGGGFAIFAGDPGPSFDDALVLGRGTWHNTVNPITSLSITPLVNFDSGSRATLYGLC